MASPKKTGKTPQKPKADAKPATKAGKPAPKRPAAKSPGA